MVSSAPTTDAAPPSAETVWLRIGYTLETIAIDRFGSVSAMAIAARRPAPPPPITTMLYEAVIAASHCRRSHFERLMLGAALVAQNLAVVADGPHVHATVVVGVPGLATAAGESDVVEAQAVIVTFDVVVARCRAPARSLLAGEMCGQCGHCPASSGLTPVMQHTSEYACQDRHVHALSEPGAQLPLEHQAIPTSTRARTAGAGSSRCWPPWASR